MLIGMRKRICSVFDHATLDHLGTNPAATGSAQMQIIVHRCPGWSPTCLTRCELKLFLLTVDLETSPSRSLSAELMKVLGAFANICTLDISLSK